LNKWNPHSTSVLSLHLSEDNLISQARDGVIKEWQIETGKIITTMETGSINFCRLARSKLGSSEIPLTTIATSNQNKDSISLWDLRSQQEISKLTLPQPAGLCMALSFEIIGGNEYLLSAFENGFIYCWDMKTQSVLHQIDSGWHEPIFSFALNSSHGIIGGASEEVIKFDYNVDINNDWHTSITNHAPIPKIGINHVLIRKDNKIFATAGWDYRVRVFSFKKCAPLAILKCHTNGIQQLKFSEVDNMLVACSQDGSISLWNLY
jgi:WD40 repeat protein